MFGHEERRLITLPRLIATPIRSHEVAGSLADAALHRGGESRLFLAEEAGAAWFRASVASFASRSAFNRAVLSMMARLAAS
jgi:hypothetical protein